MSITPSGFRTEVAGRTVTFRTGRKSQTVNICTPCQVVGDYDVIYRLPIRSAIEDPGEIPEVATLAEFATWLTERNGVSEGGSTARGKTIGLPPLVSAPINDAWVSDAVPLVNQHFGGVLPGHGKRGDRTRPTGRLAACRDDLMAALRHTPPI